MQKPSAIIDSPAAKPTFGIPKYSPNALQTGEGRVQQAGRAGAPRRSGVRARGGVAAAFPRKRCPVTAPLTPPSASAAAAEASPAARNGAAAAAAARPRNGKRCGGRAGAASEEEPPPPPHTQLTRGQPRARRRRRLAPPLPLWPPLTRPPHALSPHGLGHGRALPENGSGAAKRKRRRRRSRTDSRARAPRDAISDCVLSLGSAKSMSRGWCKQESTGLHLFNSSQWIQPILNLKIKSIVWIFYVASNVSGRFGVAW
nr:translation initiation factor IF-2 [Taeniopygia guttata]